MVAGEMRALSRGRIEARKVRSRIGWALGAILLLSLGPTLAVIHGGCGIPSPIRECETHEQCSGGRFCVEQSKDSTGCRSKECESDDDCIIPSPEELRCIEAGATEDECVEPVGVCVLFQDERRDPRCVRLDPETGLIPCRDTDRCPIDHHCDQDMDIGWGYGLCVPHTRQTYLRSGRNHLEVVIFDGPNPCRGLDLRVQGLSSGDVLVIRVLLADRAGELDFVQEDYDGSWIQSRDEPAARNEFTAFFRPHDWERDDDAPSHGYGTALDGTLRLDVPVDYDEGIIRGEYRLEFDGDFVFEGELDTRYCGHDPEVDIEFVMAEMATCGVTIGSIVSPDSTVYTTVRDMGRVGKAMGITEAQATCLMKVYECCREAHWPQDEHLELMAECMNKQPPEHVHCPS